RKNRSMKIAVIAPAWFAVPPTGYGGIEWIVSLLADALADAGHDVTLFASGDSHTKAKLAAVYAEAPSGQIGRTFWELRHARGRVRRRQRPHRHARGGPRRHRADAGRAHGARPDGRRARRDVRAGG